MVVEVTDLKFTYPSAPKPTLQGISFAIRKGEIFGLLGPSGTGKSTTQKVLIGLLKGYQGQVRIFDREVSAWGPEYYERIGVSFELPNHYLKLTALENLGFFHSLYAPGRTESPQRLLELVGLGGDGNTRVSQFSKGMKNRLTVARSLIHRPELLFLDEPTSGLDPVSRQLIRDLIVRKRDEGTTLFLTTHDMAVAAELCDRVAFIVDGEVRLIDSPRELMLRHGRREVRIEYEQEGRVLTRDVGLDTLADDAELRRLLREGHVRTLHSQEASLEKIFIEVTGRRPS